jgi:hypothetical protein
MNTQLIPSSADYVANLPSGRDVLPPQPPYTPPSLDEERLFQMRAPPTELELISGSDAGDSDFESPAAGDAHTPGTFPARADNAYY